MNMIKKLLLRKRLYFSFAIIGFLFYTYSFLEMRIADANFRVMLDENPYGYKTDICYYTVGKRKVRYLEIGADSLPLIVFIHGAPSSSSFWETFLKDSLLLSRAKLMAIDRPGYGYSDFGLPEISVKNQAAIIAELLKEKRLHHDKIVLHGSSYGGTVTARIAMDYPDLVDGMLLQSASVKPGAEKTYWISYPTNHWALRWLVPAPLRVANDEKLSHKIQLDSMANLWHRIRSAAIILHGDSDGLIYPQNAYFAKERLVNAASLEVKMIQGRGHDLLWTRRELLVESLLKLLHPGRKE